MRNGIDYITGEAETIFQNFVSKGDFRVISTEMIEVANSVQSHYSDQNDLGDVVGAGIELELVLMILTNQSVNNQKTITSELSAETLEKLVLPQNLKDKVAYLLKEVSKIGNDVKKCSILTVELAKALRELDMARKI